MEISRIFDVLENQNQNFPKKDALNHKIGGKWHAYSTQEIIETSDKIAMGLAALGIKKDDKIAIISTSRPEWNFVDFGVQKLGAVSVPMYPTITIEDYRYIFQDSGVQIIFVSDKELYEKVKEASKSIKGLDETKIYTFDEVQGAKNWTEITILADQKGDKKALEKAMKEVMGEDLLTIIYTSGTTGTPKGVMLTHDNLISNLKGACESSLLLGSEHKALSFLPLCHIYERMFIFAYFYKGLSIFYAQNMDTIGDDLKDVQPHFFATVPRLLEKVYDKIMAKVQELSPVAKRLFFWALDLANEYDTQKNKGFFYNIQLVIANNLIFEKWREALGSNIKYIACGSAALNPRLTRIFWAACIPILEGYGMTETSPVITAGSPFKEDYCIGTVGRVINGVSVKIAEDGEILVKGPNVMKGYYNQPEKTAETIDANGWLHTGDIGEFIDEKYLKITDRKKEMFKTSGGKYIAPQYIENHLKTSAIIEQAMVIGENERFPAAFLVLNEDALKHWAKQENIPFKNFETALKNADVIRKVQEEINQANTHLAHYEQIKKFAIVPNVWTIDGGELTPTLKLKRKNIMAKYQKYYEEIYQVATKVS